MSVQEQDFVEELKEKLKAKTSTFASFRLSPKKEQIQGNKELIKQFSQLCLDDYSSRLSRWLFL